MITLKQKLIYLNFGPIFKLWWCYTLYESARSWGFFGPYFPVFRLNTVQKNSEYGHFLRSDAQDVLRIANSISQRIYSTEKLLLNTMQIPNPLDNWSIMAFLPSGLGNYLICTWFTVQTLPWLLEFVIIINVKHSTIIK